MLATSAGSKSRAVYSTAGADVACVPCLSDAQSLCGFRGVRRVCDRRFLAARLLSLLLFALPRLRRGRGGFLRGLAELRQPLQFRFELELTARDFLLQLGAHALAQLDEFVDAKGIQMRIQI